MRKIAMTDAASMPPMTAVPMICRPTPLRRKRSKGQQPRMNANEVIKIGRSRRRAAFQRRIDNRLRPFSNSTLANSTIRIAFFADETDEHDQTDLGVHVRHRTHAARAPVNAPNTAIGTVRSTTNGSDQLSYSAARIRNTKSSEKPKMALAGTPCCRHLLLKRHARVVVAHFSRHGLGKHLFQRLPALAGTVARAPEMPLICAAL